MASPPGTFLYAANLPDDHDALRAVLAKYVERVDVLPPPDPSIWRAPDEYAEDEADDADQGGHKVPVGGGTAPRGLRVDSPTQSVVVDQVRCKPARDRPSAAAGPGGGPSQKRSKPNAAAKKPVVAVPTHVGTTRVSAQRMRVGRDAFVPRMADSGKLARDGEFEALWQRFERNGYVLLRRLVPRAAALEARAAIVEGLVDDGRGGYTVMATDGRAIRGTDKYVTVETTTEGDDDDGSSPGDEKNNAKESNAGDDASGTPPPSNNNPVGTTTTTTAAPEQKDANGLAVSTSEEGGGTTPPPARTADEWREIATRPAFAKVTKALEPALSALARGREVRRGRLYSAVALDPLWTWLRVKCPGEQTVEHTDAYHFAGTEADDPLGPALAPLAAPHDADDAPVFGTAWVALQDIKADVEGGLAVLGQSHAKVDYKGGPRRDRVHDDAGEATLGADSDPGRYKDAPLPKAFFHKQRPDLEWHTVDYKAGDVVLFHMRLIHATPKNLSDHLRLSLDTRFLIEPQRGASTAAWTPHLKDHLGAARARRVA